MFGLGSGEMLLLAAIALIAIGPKQLPEVARTLGKFMNEMKRATGDFTKSFTDVHDSASSNLFDAKRTVNDVFSGVTAPYTPPVHTEEQLAAEQTAREQQEAGFEKQGSLFVPTDFVAAIEEEQLEFKLTTFDESDSSRDGKDS